jgi:hypothetical protein
MIKALVMAAPVVTALYASQPAGGHVVSMQELTVPADRLPAGCVLSPAQSVRLDGNQVRSGLWAEFPSNPWTGTDRGRIISIRQIIEGPAKVPDGPPPGSKELSRYLGQLADGVEQAYGAVYLDPGENLIVVRALRFTAAEKRMAAAELPSPRRAAAALRVDIGSIAAVVAGHEGACRQAIGVYLRSLSN